jgi:hexosaminidase
VTDVTTTPIIPAPLHAETQPGPALRLGPNATVAVATVDLADAAWIFIADVARDTGVALALGGPNNATVHIELATDSLAELPATVGLRAGAGEPDDERYGLAVTADSVRVWARTPEGVHRGLTSLRQLIIAGLQSDGTALLPAMRVLDSPRFAWRGLSLDVSRCFHDADQVYRVLDMLSLHKLNVLHLHLTDDQGWRVPINGWPALTEGDNAYTVDDLNTLHEYARARHITLVPEVDMPGHVQAVFRAYPELAPADLPEQQGPIAIGTLDPERELTWSFVTDVLTEVARLFPDSRYLHIGADEAFGMADEAHATFVARTVAIVRSLGRSAIGWQEASRADLGSDEVVQYWIETGEMKAALESGMLAQILPEPMAAMVTATMAKAEHDVDLAAKKGAAVLLSPTSHLYLDRPYAEPSADPEQEALRGRLGMPFYPAKSIEQSYDWDPEAALAAAVTADVPAVAGVEAAVWCETVTCGQDLEFLLLPRLSGVAEHAWSPRGALSWDGYRRRLASLAPAWTRRGWTWFRSSSVDWPARTTEGTE